MIFIIYRDFPFFNSKRRVSLCEPQSFLSSRDDELWRNKEQFMRKIYTKRTRFKILFVFLSPTLI